MCNICYAQANKINMISSSPETMCDDHYFEWANEKACAELDMMEDYYHMIQITETAADFPSFVKLRECDFSHRKMSDLIGFWI